MTNSVMKLMLAETENKNPLTFTAAEAGAIVSLNRIRNVDNVIPTIKYRTSYDETWQDYQYETKINLINVGDWVQFEGNESYFSVNTNNYVTAGMAKTVYASGELTSLIGYAKHIPAYCFHKFFQANSSNFYSETHLLSAPSINADYAETEALSYLYNGQNGLTNIEINVDTVENNTFYFTFNYCKGLKYVKLKSFENVSSGYCFYNNNNGFTIEIVKPLTSGLTLKNYSSPKNCTLICNADSYIKLGSTIPDDWNIQINSPGMLLTHFDTKDVYSEAKAVVNVKYASSEPVEVIFNNLPENYSYEVNEYDIKISYDGGIFSSPGPTNDITLTLKSANFEKSTSFKFRHQNNVVSLTNIEYAYVKGDGTETQPIQYTYVGIIPPDGIMTTLISGTLPNGVTLTSSGYFKVNNSILVDDTKVVRIKIESRTGNSVPGESDLTISTKTAQGVLNDKSLTFYSTFNDSENYVNANVFANGNNAVRTYKKTIDDVEVEYIEVGAFNTNDGFSNVIPIYQAILTGENRFINLNTGNVESTMKATINSQGGGSAKITISGADQTGANQTYSLSSGDPDNLASGTPVIFTGDSNTSSMTWTIKFQYIPEAYMTEVNIYCDLMIGVGPELQYMTMSAAEPTIDNILKNSPIWTDSTGSSRKDLSVTYSAGGSSSNAKTITVTGFGIAIFEKYNTTYQLSQDGTYWYSNATPDDYYQERITYGDHPGNGNKCWIFGDDTGNMEAFIYSTNSDPMSIVGNQSCDDAYGTNYTLTITASDGDNSNTETPTSVIIEGCTTQMFNKEYSFNSAVPSYVPKIGNIMNVNGEINFGELSGKQYLEFLADDNSDRICNIYDADYWTKPTGASIPNITFSFSFCLFEYPVNDAVILAVGQDKSITDGVDIWIGINSSKRLFFELARHQRATLKAIELNTWYNISITVVNNTIKAYLNGNKVGTDVLRKYKALANSFLGINGRKFAFSGDAAADELNYFKYNNKMAFTNLRIYNKSFTENEIKILANEGI